MWLFSFFCTLLVLLLFYNLPPLLWEKKFCTEISIKRVDKSKNRYRKKPRVWEPVLFEAGKMDLSSTSIVHCRKPWRSSYVVNRVLNLPCRQRSVCTIKRHIFSSVVLGRLNIHNKMILASVKNSIFSESKKLHLNGIA